MVTTLESPAIDMTSLNAIDSIFESSNKDPWSGEIIGDFANFIIYSKFPRFIIPLKNEDVDISDVRISPLLQEIIQAEPNLLRPHKYFTSEKKELALDQIEPAFAHFLKWSYSNGGRLKTWLGLHRQEWVRSSHYQRVPSGYVYNVDQLDNAAAGQLAHDLGVHPGEILYAFDVVLRYPLYGEMTGERDRYLHHPIRNACKLPNVQFGKPDVSALPLCFKAMATRWAPTASRSEFVNSMLKLRDEVWKTGLVELGPGEIERDAIRDLAAKASIPPSLRDVAKYLAIGGTGLATLGALPLGAPALLGIAGGIVTVIGIVWQGNLPASAGRVQWLRWVVEWPELESQTEN